MVEITGLLRKQKEYFNEFSEDFEKAFKAPIGEYIENLEPHVDLGKVSRLGLNYVVETMGLIPVPDLRPSQEILDELERKNPTGLMGIMVLEGMYNKASEEELKIKIAEDCRNENLILDYFFNLAGKELCFNDYHELARFAVHNYGNLIKDMLIYDLDSFQGESLVALRGTNFDFNNDGKFLFSALLMKDDDDLEKSFEESKKAKVKHLNYLMRRDDPDVMNHLDFIGQFSDNKKYIIHLAKNLPSRIDFVFGLLKEKGLRNKDLIEDSIYSWMNIQNE